MRRSVRFYTLGCKTNQYETQAIKESVFSSALFKEAAREEKPDLYVINTCTVTSKADRDSRWRVRQCHKENPRAGIAVIGCLAELDEAMIRSLPGVTHIVKNRDKHRIPDILCKAEGPRHMAADTGHFIPLKIRTFKGRTRAFVKIQDGCDNVCSYCKIRLVRGSSRSRGADSALSEVKGLVRKGFKEVILTGICLGGLGRDLKGAPELPDLLEGITSIRGDFRVRLSSIEPDLVTKRLIEKIAGSGKICRHLHIPLQSGCDSILRSMRRSYTKKKYAGLIDSIRKAVTDISVTTDVIVGFPGETRSDFNETAGFLKDIAASGLHVFSYSNRPGTEAAGLKPEVAPEEIKIRRKLLQDLGTKLSCNYRGRFLEKEVSGLIETNRDKKTGLLTGYTDTYIKFILEGEDALMGKIVPLRVNKLEEDSTFCQYLQK